jgi:riboflavin kinase/FMN adenylyltransferase
MEVIRDEATCPRQDRGSAVTIGQFDGVHAGHRAVIGEVRRLAADEGLATAVVTFDRHPASVLRPDSAPMLLTDLEQKLELLAETGIDYTLVIDFDEQRRRETAEEFVTEVLLHCLNARAVAVGEDFHFGFQRKGTVDLLRSMGAEEDFEVVGLELLGSASDDVQPISSTAIRRALTEGHLGAANAMLGRHHEVRGPVVLGDRRGRELGFPTANVAVPGDAQLPADGIYAGWYLRADGHRHPTAISLGRRPTFYDEADASLLEAHLLDFDGDLYGETARVQFVAHLRGEQRFDAVADLIAQMTRDCQRTRRILGL